MNESLYHALILPNATLNGDAPALQQGDKIVSYRSLIENTEAQATHIDALNIAAGTPIALLGRKCPELYSSLLACLSRKQPWVPLHPEFPSHRNARMLQLSGSQILWTDNPQSPALIALSNRGIQLIELGHGFYRIFYNNNNEALSTKHNDIAYILFTSGSTGSPKGIAVSYANLNAYIEGFNTRFSLPSGLRFSHCFELTFDLSVHDMMICWSNLGCLVIPNPNDLMLPLQYIRKQHLNVWFSVPTMANLAIQSGLLRKNTLPSLRYSFFCGEALSSSTAAHWMTAAPDSRTINLYGPTEATIAITAYELARNDEAGWQHTHVVPLGQLLPNQRLRIVDQEGNDCLPGEPGELWLYGSQITSGYLDAPDKTAAAFVSNNGYRTGDCCRINSQGELEYLGRMDRQIKINGYRIELQEIEYWLSNIAKSPQAAVIAHSIPGIQGAALHGFITRQPASIPSLLEELTQHLPSYMQLSDIHYLQKLPLNANGKVDYPALHNLLA